MPSIHKKKQSLNQIMIAKLTINFDFATWNLKNVVFVSDNDKK